MRYWIALTLFLTCTLRGQSQPLVLDDLLPSVQQWVRDNLDDSVLAALEQIDQDRVKGSVLDIDT